ncbi:uncharacterized protein LOC123403128 [Hordeum vulgare subsp. vulgare]|uniref:uncharacterized protein LOC123403128 n=1 Tax=Hordeum vulgare subsp. vulgare TaxID=112509 RepID=UPI001D1A4EA9|nr:uncharacterized protein LOC123403128 [Hordeum vulgare subsp. vulgare]
MADNRRGHGDPGGQVYSDGRKDKTQANRDDSDRRGHGDPGGQAYSDGRKDKTQANRDDSDRRGHGDPGGQAHSDGHKENTFADRDEWDRYRADEGVLPGNAPVESFLSKLARAAAASACHARHMKQTMGKYFNAQEKKEPTTYITREEFLDFKASLEHSLKEVKAAVDNSAKDQYTLIEACSSANSKIMQKVFRHLDEVSKEVKAAVDAGVKSQETSADTADKIFKLMDELSSTLKEAPLPPSKAGDLLSRLEKLALFPKKVINICDLVSYYATIIGGVCLTAGLFDSKLGLLDPKVEQSLIERFFPSNNPGLFEDIGRRTRDVLFKDFEPNMSVPIEPRLDDVMLLSSFANKSPVQIIVGNQLKLRHGSMGLDIKVDPTSHVSALLSFPCAFGADYVPKIRMCYPFRDSSTTLDAFYENAAVRANVSMHPVRGDAMLSLSGLFGTKAFNLGGEHGGAPWECRAEHLFSWWIC